MVPSTLAKARAIDLSIQFTLFWVPFLVLLAWWISKPLHLMFGASFLDTNHREENALTWECYRLLRACDVAWFMFLG